MMGNDGLITYHNIYRRPTMRGYVVMGWLHYGSILEDKETGKKYIVDSWFEDNGHPAHVVPLKKWKAGWRPQHKKG